MRRFLNSGLCGLGVCLLLATAAWAAKWGAADFPLRVRIFQFNAHSHYYYRSLDAVDGEGRADLFENGQPLGFDFGYECGSRIMVSAGYETYMARWKKPGRELEILLPVLGGKPGEMNSCDLQVTLKQDSVYVRHNGLMSEEPAAKYKSWMIKHQYDPEHGLNEPVNAAAEPPAQNGAPEPPSPSQPSQPQAPPSGTQ
jgi:hypothetical protein